MGAVCESVDSAVPNVFCAAASVSRACGTTSVSEPLRIKRHRYLHAEALLFLVVFDTDVGHLPERDSAKVDGRADGQSAQRLVESHDHIERLAVGLAHGLRLVRGKTKDRLVNCRWPGVQPRRRLERQPSDHNGRERMRIELQAVRIETQIDAACVPPPRMGANVAVEGRIDEDIHDDA